MKKSRPGKDFSTSFVVDASPDDVFNAINDVRGWWTGEITGKTAKVGDEFTYKYDDLHYSKQRVTESIPGERVVWLVLEANLTFVSKKTEWKGTEVMFEIAPTAKGTKVRFTHKGLVPHFECYDGCSEGWSHYIDDVLPTFIGKHGKKR